MSYDLAFWAGGDDLEPDDAYARLCAGEHVDGIDAVQPTRIAQAFAERLGDWAWDGQMLTPPGSEPNGPAFDVDIGAQMITFVGYGFTGELGNAIIDTMHPLGYRLYDPQVRERFA